MFEKRYPEACPKLAESHRLDPAGGTLLTLAFCHEAEGRTATAWTEFREAEAVALREGRRDRQAAAREKADALEPRLSRLVIQPAPELESITGIEVRNDGSPVPKALWGTPFPVDPGEHRVEAIAQGRKPLSVIVMVGKQSDRQTVSIPLLETVPVATPSAAPAPSTPPPAVAPAPTPAAVRPTPAAPERGSKAGTSAAGWALTGLGSVLLVAGGWFGLQALERMADADSACPKKQCSDPDGLRASDDAERYATFANVGLGLGLVSLGSGIYLVASQPSSAAVQRTGESPPRMGGVVRAGLSLGGTW